MNFANKRKRFSAREEEEEGGNLCDCINRSTLRTYTNGEEFLFRMETMLIENQVGIRVD